jgi:hypothetical protein
MVYDLSISAQQVNLIWSTSTLVTKKDTWETESSMFTQIQDIVHIFFPILHVKMDGHLKINTESYTCCTCGGLVNKENTPFVQ